ncbi:MAG: hypothetical protein QNJ46_06000 [Leptolyngbyaceae cyanobacterium MO_188.B28]|nr:hypothetical protein [Leptolyngbyaceae cyanobacterium MO_188.B28]
MSFLDTLITQVQQAAIPEKVSVDSGEFVIRHKDSSVSLPPRESSVEAHSICTLTGLIQYIKTDPDGAVESVGLHLVVESPIIVKAYSHVEGRHKQRDIYIESCCGPVIGNGFKFNQWHSQDQFIINALSQFQPSDDLTKVLEIVSKLVSSSEKNLTDDGLAQSATVKKGISTLATVEIPKRVKLRPYRTFAEITEQPESEFVLRLRELGEKIEIALFEADGGAWKLEAIQAIAAYLKDSLPDTCILA